MTMIQKSPKLTYLFTKENRKIVKDMLLLLQHPFILPVTDIDFMVDQNIVVVVYPISQRGSLKDYIYQVGILRDPFTYCSDLFTILGLWVM